MSERWDEGVLFFSSLVGAAVAKHACLAWIQSRYEESKFQKVGVISDLYVWPVKSFGGLKVEFARATRTGLDHNGASDRYCHVNMICTNNPCKIYSLSMYTNYLCLAWYPLTPQGALVSHSGILPFLSLPIPLRPSSFVRRCRRYFSTKKTTHSGFYSFYLILFKFDIYDHWANALQKCVRIRNLTAGSHYYWCFNSFHQQVQDLRNILSLVGTKLY